MLLREDPSSFCSASRYKQKSHLPPISNLQTSFEKQPCKGKQASLQTFAGAGAGSDAQGLSHCCAARGVQLASTLHSSEIGRDRVLRCKNPLKGKLVAVLPSIVSDAVLCLKRDCNVRAAYHPEQAALQQF